MRTDRVSLLALITLLLSCGGGGADAPPPSPPPEPPPVAIEATATLNAKVLRLTDVQEAALESASPSQLLFDGAHTFLGGEVYLGRTTAFRVLSSSTSAGKTTVLTTDPTIEDLFQRVRITTRTASQTTAVFDRKAATGATPTAVDAITGNFSKNVSVKAAGLDADGTLDGRISAVIDYSFDADKGGLQNGSVSIESESELTARLSFSAQKSLADETQVHIVRVPIPITVFDRLLNQVGVYPASFVVPISIGAFLDGGFSGSAIAKYQLHASGTIDYASSGGTTTDFHYTAIPSLDSDNPQVPTGAEAWTVSRVLVGPSLRLRPGLLLLNRVAFMGADLNFRLANNLTLQGPVPDPPNYCLSFSINGDVQYSAFFKSAAGVNLASETQTASVFNTAPRYAGACRTKLVARLLGTVPQVLSYGQIAAVKVELSADPAALSVPQASPTGSVDIAVGTTSCKSQLAPSGVGSATAECSLTPMTAGSSVPLTLSYDGDAAFGPVSDAIGALSVRKAPTLATIVTTPNPSLAGTNVVFSATVSPSPLVAGVPTGRVDFRSDSGLVVCSAEVDPTGSAKCSSDTIAVGEHSYNARYVGDPLFASSSSGLYVHSVNSSLSIYRLASGATEPMTIDGVSVGTPSPGVVITPIAVQFKRSDSSVINTAPLTTPIFTSTSEVGSTFNVIPFSPSICKLNGKWVAKTYAWTAAFDNPYRNGCTGSSGARYSGSVTLTDAGQLRVSYSSTGYADQFCTNFETHALSVKNQSMSMQLASGSGEVSYNSTSDTTTTSGGTTRTSSHTIGIVGPSSWSEELIQPPTLETLFLTLSRTVPFDDTAVPDECK